MTTKINNKKKSATICLNMIVKNEADIIVDTLNNIWKYIHFDYWVICDTGSTDKTKEIITAFFSEKNITGELLEHEWRDFAHNRTKALECAFKKTDYVLIFDADDRIEGNFLLPPVMNKDSYYLKIGTDCSYRRQLLITNQKRWRFKGVLHEFLDEIDSMTRGSETIEGNYCMISGHFGNRSKNINKYYDDAIVLQNAFEKETNDINGDKHLAGRYAFYCARSYEDAGQQHYSDSIKWYKKVLESKTNWIQEKYYSGLAIGNLYNKLNDTSNAIRYWIKSSDYDKERIEGIVSAMDCLRNKGDHVMVNLLYKKFKNYNKNVSADKLFVERDKYNDLIEYNNSISAFYVPNEKESGYECCKKIIRNNIISENLLKSTLSNLMFYKEYIEKDNDKTIYNRLIGKENTARFSKEECMASKNILFYTGYANQLWNHSYMKKKSLGGSEKAVAYLSKQFPKEYNIYVSGVVENEKVDNVTYIHLNELQNLINITPFHTIICSRYIAFLEMFNEVAFYQFYIWAHDTQLLPYGCHLTHTQIITKWNKSINGCICQTNWHAKEFERIYPELKNKINIINNGIDTTLYTSSSSSWIQNSNDKIKNKFIYSSCSERGLRIVVELWGKILEILPDASLVISSYNKFPADNENDIFIKNIIDNYPDSITHLGQLSVEKLYDQMSSAEYWLYPTSWPETSCITAMEMLANGVICIYYPVAGLVDTMKEYGISVNNIDEIMDSLINLSNDEERKKELRENGQNYSFLSCSWEKRAEEWNKVLLL